MTEKIYTLPEGQTLKSPNNTYSIESVIGSGGFGITYLASTITKVCNLFFIIMNRYNYQNILLLCLLSLVLSIDSYSRELDIVKSRNIVNGVLTQINLRDGRTIKDKDVHGIILKSSSGNTDATFLLGICHYYGLCGERNESIAWNHIVYAADHGCVKAAYESGLNESYDIDKRIKWLMVAAEQNDYKACNKLATIYHDKRDDHSALSWYLKAAGIHNNGLDFRMAGLIYESFKEYDLASECYCNAAVAPTEDLTGYEQWEVNSEIIDAYTELVFLHDSYYGDYKERELRTDKNKLEDKLRTAAKSFLNAFKIKVLDNDSPFINSYIKCRAYFSAGYCYEHGFNDTIDYNKAIEYYQKFNGPMADQRIAYIYYNGGLGKPDYEKAVSIITKNGTERIGVTGAMILSKCYRFGRGGLNQDIEKADYWLDYAAKKSKEAEKIRNIKF